MVYAKFGRTAIYQVQNMMKMITTDRGNIEADLIVAKETLNSLPNNHWFDTNLFAEKFGAEEMYDILLHKRDVSYSVHDLFRWLFMAAINFVEFDSHGRKMDLQFWHRSLDNIIHRYVSSRTYLWRLSFVEILLGKYVKQDFYASKSEDSVANLYVRSNILYLYGNPLGIKQAVYDKNNRYIAENQTYFSAWMTGVFLRHDMLRHATIDQGIDHAKFVLRANKFFFFVMKRLLRSKSGISIDSIIDEYSYKDGNNQSKSQVHHMLVDFYKSVECTEMFLLRGKRIGIFQRTAFHTLFQVHMNNIMNTL